MDNNQNGGAQGDKEKSGVTENRIYSRTAGTRKTVRNGLEERSLREMRVSLEEELHDAESRRRIERKRKQERQRRRQLRAAAVIVAALAVMIILIFMTPIFNIRQIKVLGNNYVEIGTIQSKIGDIVGQNLFSTRKSGIESKMLEIPQIDEVEVKKNYFPPSIVVTVREAVPAAYMLSGNTIIVVSTDLKIIDDSQTFDVDTLPSISGISVSSYELSKQIDSGSPDKEDILRTLLQGMDNTGILAKTTYISVDDITSIKFNYDNRIEVLCGSQLELERKIRMFAAAMESPTMKTNSLGTMDLSVPGRAVYTP
ncbi:MAG: FtsQ-type POTRA domain-containing protein [Oscillospiraceae bacterium]|nr:FtsQ-type POTRA domain-containing protein [Oscillospiraceae bacterium]